MTVHKIMMGVCEKDRIQLEGPIGQIWDKLRTKKRNSNELGNIKKIENHESMAIISK
jgi:hypothetical protein